MTEKQNIYQIISAISSEVGAIELTEKSGVPFPFRGIDHTVNVLSPVLRRHGVITVPQVQSLIVTPKDVGNRTVKTAEVITKFTFYAPDGTFIEAITAGLADDFGDRSVAQAQSVAFRIALLQTFTLPTQSPDPEETGQKTQDDAAAIKETAEKQPTKTEASISEIRAEIAKFIADPATPYDGAMVNALGNEISGETPDEWGGKLPILKKLLARLEAGEVAGG